MLEAILFSEMSVFTRATRHHIPDGGILYSHRHENRKFYIHACAMKMDVERIIGIFGFVAVINAPAEICEREF
jgi:glutaminase